MCSVKLCFLLFLPPSRGLQHKSFYNHCTIIVAEWRALNAFELCGNFFIARLPIRYTTISIYLEKICKSFRVT